MADFPPDDRHILCGRPIPSLHYCDQVYVTLTDDGAWLAVMTTGDGKEGERGQHIVALRSTDEGRTWSEPVAIEPPDGPEASYAVLCKVPGGRIYAFYNHNTDRVASVPREDGGSWSRVDSLGRYVFKFSDDHGRTWFGQRYEVSIREFAADRENLLGGKVRFFWNVGRPFVSRERVYLPHIKVGAMGDGFYAQSEGALLSSPNLLTENDPTLIHFDTLPDGDLGLRTPAGGGRISEEQSVVELSDGSLYCVYRSVDGYPVCSYSRDQGHTWEPPQYKTFSPGGRRMKHPRAANFVWKCSNGKYLYWFHNHGGGPSARGAWNPYDDRNPVWLSAGEEADSPGGRLIVWSQPEILLYDDDPCIRMSYPDLIETEGRFFVTETQKTVARVHEINPGLLDMLFAQSSLCQTTREGLLLETSHPQGAEAPILPAFFRRDYTREDQAGTATREGFTIDLSFSCPVWTPDAILLSNLDTRRRGFEIRTTLDKRLEIVLSDGRSESRWISDTGWFRPGALHHAAFIVDGGPRIISIVTDGQLSDGGEDRQFGWGRFSPHLTHVNGAPTFQAHSNVSLLRIYGRALRTSEAIGNFRA